MAVEISLEHICQIFVGYSSHGLNLFLLQIASETLSMPTLQKIAEAVRQLQEVIASGAGNAGAQSHIQCETEAAEGRGAGLMHTGNQFVTRLNFFGSALCSLP